jgi:hypothetical protein
MAGRTGRRFRQRLALSNVVVVPDAQFRQGFLPCYIATPSACGSNPGQYVTVRNLRTGMLPSPITSGPPRTARNSPRTACRRGPPTPSVIPLKRRGSHGPDGNSRGRALSTASDEGQERNSGGRRDRHSRPHG